MADQLGAYCYALFQIFINVEWKNGDMPRSCCSEVAVEVASVDTLLRIPDQVLFQSAYFDHSSYDQFQ